MQFYSEYSPAAYVFYGIEHHFTGLSGESQDQMSHDRNAAAYQFFDCEVIIVKRVAEIHFCGSFCMYGLKSEFHPHECFFVELCEQIDHVIRQTVRPCSYGDAFYRRVFESRTELFAKLSNGCICIRVALEVRYVACAGPFVRKQRYLAVEVGYDISRTGSSVT